MTAEEREKAERHKKRMERKKELVDAAIIRADEERGIVVLLTGNGKGKSSSAFGMVARALGHGQRIGIVQFIKGGDAAGEQLFFQDHERVEYHVMGTGFTWESRDREKDIAAAQALWCKAKEMLQDPAINLLVMDELTYMFKYDYLPWEEVRLAIENRPKEQSVVITGRAARQELIDLADTVSEVRDIKHAFRAGLKARKGVEF